MLMSSEFAVSVSRDSCIYFARTLKALPLSSAPSSYTASENYKTHRCGMNKLAVNREIRAMSNVRADLKEVDAQISRLLVIGEAFRSKDRDWSHLKNKEDWGRNIPQIKSGLKKAKVERVYCDGRDMAGFMADALLSINYDITQYPNLTSIIERFNGSWVYLDLDLVVEDAQRTHEELQLNCWAFNQMVFTFKDQQKLAKVVRQTLDHMKESDLYKRENGLPIENNMPHVSFGNVTGSNISVGSTSVAQSINDSSTVFLQLKDAIQSVEIEGRKPLLQAVEKMENTLGTSKFTQAYQQFISFAADHLAIFTPLLPALTALL